VTVDQPKIRSAADALWQRYLPDLEALVKIPAVSPSFDPDWASRGAVDAIVEAAAGWLRDRDGAPEVTVSRIDGRTPLVFACSAGQDAAAPRVLFYGHLDKQPAGDGWTVTAPWSPAVRGGRLYGRGAADDCYAIVAAWGAVEAARAAGVPLPRCAILLEASEESSSADLPAHLDALADRIGQPDLVVCLDAFSPDATRVWCTTSLRGIVVLDVTASVLRRPVHSGDAGSIVPSPFRVLRRLLDRVEDAATGRVLLEALRTIPPASLASTVDGMAAAGLGSPTGGFSLLEGVTPEHAGLRDQFAHRAWDPVIAYVGLDGMPPATSAASVLLPSVTLRLSVRIPPDLDPLTAADALTGSLLADPPAGAHVQVNVVAAQRGFSAPPLAPATAAVLDRASVAQYGTVAGRYAAGVTIPFMGMLRERFPRAQVLAVGALGPGSNPHAPDESLDLRAAAALTAALAEVIANGL
jgi:acetylornithine deacetylase/succinyl-diaminopimelate desuccinylase-like protein